MIENDCQKYNDRSGCPKAPICIKKMRGAFFFARISNFQSKLLISYNNGLKKTHLLKQIFNIFPLFGHVVGHTNIQKTHQSSFFICSSRCRTIGSVTMTAHGPTLLARNSVRAQVCAGPSPSHVRAQVMCRPKSCAGPSHVRTQVQVMCGPK